MVQVNLVQTNTSPFLSKRSLRDLAILTYLAMNNPKKSWSKPCKSEIFISGMISLVLLLLLVINMAAIFVPSVGKMPILVPSISAQLPF